MFSPMSVIHEMIEDGDEWMVHADFQKIADECKDAEEFYKRTGVNWYHRYTKNKK